MFMCSPEVRADRVRPCVHGERAHLRRKRGTHLAACPRLRAEQHHKVLAHIKLVEAHRVRDCGGEDVELFRYRARGWVVLAAIEEEAPALGQRRPLYRSCGIAAVAGRAKRQDLDLQALRVELKLRSECLTQQKAVLNSRQLNASS